MDPDHAHNPADRIKQLHDEVLAEQQNMSKAIFACNAPFKALTQQRLCQGSACVCSTLAAAVEPVKAAVVRCSACLTPLWKCSGWGGTA
jgi:hypothetical protein